MKSIFFALALTLNAYAGAQAYRRAEIQKIGRSHLQVVVPTFMPKGYRENKMDLNDHSVEDEDFNVSFTNRKDGVITIQMASSGIGDIIFTLADGNTVEPTSTAMIRTKLLGKVAVDRYDSKIIHDFHFDWIDLGTNHHPRFILVHGVSVTKADALNFVKGLRWLNAK